MGKEPQWLTDGLYSLLRLLSNWSSSRLQTTSPCTDLCKIISNRLHTRCGGVQTELRHGIHLGFYLSFYTPQYTWKEKIPCQKWLIWEIIYTEVCRIINNFRVNPASWLNLATGTHSVQPIAYKFTHLSRVHTLMEANCWQVAAIDLSSLASINI